MNNKTKNKVEKIKSLPVPSEVEAPSTAVEPTRVFISSFSGEFGRVDLNLLRDKVNEIPTLSRHLI